jgi:hypothetical protein
VFASVISQNVAGVEGGMAAVIFQPLVATMDWVGFFESGRVGLGDQSAFVVGPGHVFRNWRDFILRQGTGGQMVKA